LGRKRKGENRKERRRKRGKNGKRERKGGEIQILRERMEGRGREEGRGKYTDIGAKKEGRE
jgi:hypothetical protein